LSTAVVLFTRDLRLRDHPSLHAALQRADRIVPAFVLDDALLRSAAGAPNRLQFLAGSLADLDRSLRERGSRLVIRRGDVIAESLRLVRESKATALHVSADVSGYATLRERRLRRECERCRVAFRSFPGVTAVPPGEITPANGDHYRVFTPYWRAWSSAPMRTALPRPRHVPTVPGIRGERPPVVHSLTGGTPSPDLPTGGESAGARGLDAWARSGVDRYEGARDDLAADATSHLSPYLHFGCLSAVDALARTEDGPARQAFARQVCWRDFHHQVLSARPDIAAADYRPRGDRWRRDRRLIEAWTGARTGYPIVDAGLRQLEREGFMHNRTRLITASFLTKLLYVDWRVGAAHFASLLVDADLAANVGNWQWVAGTGNDTRPNRVLNPIRQARRFDPKGDYVRRHVPELSAVPGPAVHEPWRLDPAERRRLDYPEPIVDHELAAAEFKQRRGSQALPPAMASD
jgi:deoxyribodipyrimidine photo-lyase